MSALDTQVGGSHYKDMAIQPVEFIVKNDIPYREANAIKYLCRWRRKNGVDDLRKAAHYIQMLIDEQLQLQAEDDAFERGLLKTGQGDYSDTRCL